MNWDSRSDSMMVLLVPDSVTSSVLGLMRVEIRLPGTLFSRHCNKLHDRIARKRIAA